jgi:hypothetical protein
MGRRYEGEEVGREKARRRKKIGTLGSVLKSVYLSGKVRAVSFKGFILKILMAIFPYNLSRWLRWQLEL